MLRDLGVNDVCGRECTRGTVHGAITLVAGPGRTGRSGWDARWGISNVRDSGWDRGGATDGGTFRASTTVTARAGVVGARLVSDT